MTAKKMKTTMVLISAVSSGLSRNCRRPPLRRRPPEISYFAASTDIGSSEVLFDELGDLLGILLGDEAGTRREEVGDRLQGVAQIVRQHQHRHVAFKELLLIDREVDLAVLQGVEHGGAEVDGAEVHALGAVAELLAHGHHRRTAAAADREHAFDGRILL